MILVDANILLYAENVADPHHVKALSWWDEQLSSSAPIALCWPVINAFIRIGTNARVLPKPMSLDHAIERVNGWLDIPSVSLVAPTDDHWEWFARLLREAKASANLVSDAHLAAIAMAHGCELCSSDSDFGRFPKLRWRNPITDP